MRILKRIGFVFKRKKADMLFMDARIKPKHDGYRCVTGGDTTRLSSPCIPSLSSPRTPSLSFPRRRESTNNNTVLHNARHPHRFAEVGRSMVEMLGVLVIIGVLSIAAVAGYRFALTKFRANEVINELNMRALSASAQMLNTGWEYELNEFITDGFTDTLTVGYPAETAVSDRNTDYFEVLVQDIPADLCRQILRDYENPVVIFVNDEPYNNDTSLCGADDALNDMGFVYRRDLGEHDKCSEKGYFGVEDFLCHCSGNTYIDPDNPTECLCPAGHVWSAAENTCIESICPEGQFESLTSGCVPCDDTKTYAIATDARHKQLCVASTCGRIVVGSNCVNQDVNNCIPGESFRKDNGECVSCSQASYVYLISTEAKNSCTQNCSDQRVLMGPWCVNKDWCPDDNRHFFRFDLSQGSGLSCISCDYAYESVIWGLSDGNDTVSRCSKCTDAEGAFNRAVKQKNGKDYCGFRNCTSTQFKSADMACYDCNEVKAVYIGTSDETLKSSCVACGNREVTDDGYCRIADCSPGTGIRMKDGTCYPCNHYISNTPHIYLSQMDNTDDCEKCTERTARDGICYNDSVCALGSGWWLGASAHSICYTCQQKRVTYCSAYGCELCDGCDGQHATGGRCVLDDACNNTGQFQDKSNGCVDCAYTQKVDIGTHDIERSHCRACTTTPRFWAGSYCYRCDTTETPDVTLEEEEKSCVSCAEREIKDKKCVLRQ